MLLMHVPKYFNMFKIIFEVLVGKFVLKFWLRFLINEVLLKLHNIFLTVNLTI